jgi:hypothetical protein
MTNPGTDQWLKASPFDRLATRSRSSSRVDQDQ